MNKTKNKNNMWTKNEREDWMREHHPKNASNRLSTNAMLNILTAYANRNGGKMSIFYKHYGEDENIEGTWSLVMYNMSGPVYGESFDDVVKSAYILLIEGLDIIGDMNEAYWRKYAAELNAKGETVEVGMKILGKGYIEDRSNNSGWPTVYIGMVGYGAREGDR